MLVNASSDTGMSRNLMPSHWLNQGWCFIKCTSSKKFHLFFFETTIFFSTRCIWTCRLLDGGLFVQTLNVLIDDNYLPPCALLYYYMTLSTMAWQSNKSQFVHMPRPKCAWWLTWAEYRSLSSLSITVYRDCAAELSRRLFCNENICC